MPQFVSQAMNDETAHQIQIDHGYDYDRSIKKGFARVYSDLDCSVRARDQNKPMYAPEM
jgi:hypothetical protein